MNRPPHIIHPRSRREFLQLAGAGFGSLALSYLLSRDSAVASIANPSSQIANPLAAKPPHFNPKAKSVIFLFMEGGPSHIDLYDPKPTLAKLHNQPMPASFGKVITAMGTASNTLMASPRKFKQHGQAGTW